MPNIKSAKKRVLVTETKRQQNKVTKSIMRTQMRKVHTALAAGDKALALEMYAPAAAALDKAARKNVIHKNTAANKKSGLMLEINKL